MADMTQWIYVLRLVRPEALREALTERELAALGAHVEYQTRLAAEGTIVMSGRTQTDGPETFGIALIVAEDETAARAIMDADPGVTGGLQTAELFPYQVAFGNADSFARVLGEGRA
jgi:uncharacterized protein YciI